MMSYKIILPQFEGPFDLLLYFIERDELDINDIPIATVTDDYLEYIRHLEALNIDVASEFILVAATLMRIKAKMLIPRKEVDEEGNEIDPREELVQKLLEYKRYKSVLDDMRDLEQKRALQFGRGNGSQELRKLATTALADAELESLTLFKLLKAFQRVVERFEDSKMKIVHRVYHYNYTIKGQSLFILDQVQTHEKTPFDALFNNCEDRIHAIVTFLAMLELLNQFYISCISGEGINNFWITTGEATPEPGQFDESEESAEIDTPPAPELN